jgi:hypothetical protein
MHCTAPILIQYQVGYTSPSGLRCILYGSSFTVVLLYHIVPFMDTLQSCHRTDRIPRHRNSVHPCFYVEELQGELKARYAHLALPISAATVLRVLHFDLNLTRKVLERRAREAVPLEIATYKAKMAAFYTYPEQLLFIDETAKKGTDAMRKYAWAPRGKKAIVHVPFRKGRRKPTRIQTHSNLRHYTDRA